MPPRQSYFLSKTSGKLGRSRRARQQQDRPLTGLCSNGGHASNDIHDILVVIKPFFIDHLTRDYYIGNIDDRESGEESRISEENSAAQNWPRPAISMVHIPCDTDIRPTNPYITIPSSVIRPDGRGHSGNSKQGT